MTKILPYTLLLCLAFEGFGCSNKQPNNVIVNDSQTVSDTAPAKAAANEYDPNDDPEARKISKKPELNPEELPVRKVGELVLKDSIDIYDNEVMSFMILDSLLSDKKTSRDFYFQVFNKMMDRSGGVYGDAIGDYALTYVETYPKEFLNNSKSFSVNRMESWASNIGIELFLSSQNKREAFNRSTRNIETNCRNCDSADISRLQVFNKMIWTTIEQNLEERTN